MTAGDNARHLVALTLPPRGTASSARSPETVSDNAG
jgi:hypothetical protein